ncbi:MAG: DUF3592 domain-containing protein [Candidatus Kariarchaeaceae archaeon]|jgi:hypothetical protein
MERPVKYKKLKRILKILLYLIITILPGGFAVALLTWMLFNTYNGYLSRNWPYVVGKITKSRGERGGDTVSFSLRYEYIVDEFKYKSSRKNFGGYSSGGAGVNDEIERFPENSEAVVFYHPKKHHRATLMPGIQKSNFLTLIFIPLASIPHAIILLLWYYW